MKIYSSGNNPVIASEDVFPDLIRWLSQQSFSRIFIITDDNCYVHCYPLLVSAIGKRYTLIPVVFPAGEKSKDIGTCNFIWQKLSEANADKKDIVLNLGGGVVTDIGAFAASIYKRGIRFINMPTSLMGMVDAATGGKCGVDFREIKNHLGLISFPSAVFIHFDFLNTLPERHIRNGYAEIFKAGFIADKDLADNLPINFSKDISHQIILKSLEIKLNITERDPFEKDIRKALNFGHTCGHAIESCMLKTAQSEIFHGDAIVAGMIMEFLLSVDFAGLNNTTAERCINMLIDFFGKPDISTVREDEFISFVLHDKKNGSGHIIPCLLHEIADPVWDIAVPENAFRNVLMRFHHLHKHA